MVGDLGSRGFVIDDWYWRISENAQTFDAAAAARDFLTPLARHAKGRVAIAAIEAHDNQLRFVLDAEPQTIDIARGAHDKVAINHFVCDLNRLLSAKHLAFALVVPRRYELRGVLLTEDELLQLSGTQGLLVPSGRRSSGSIPTPKL